MGSHEKKMHFVDMSSLLILFKAKSGVSQFLFSFFGQNLVFEEIYPSEHGLMKHFD